MNDDYQIPVNRQAALAIENGCVYVTVERVTQAIIPLDNIVAIVKYG